MIDDTTETKRRGRPALSDEEAKRAPVSFRTTPQVRDRIVAAAEEAGRSVAQEVEFRLEQSFAREAEAGSRSAAVLADFARLAASIVEGQTGKQWTDDADTYFRLLSAIRAFMTANHPPASEYMAELDAAAEGMREADAALAPQEPLINALLGKPEDPAALIALGEALTRYRAASAGYLEAQERNKEAGREAATTLGHIFRLRPSGAAERKDDTAPAAREDAI